MKLKKVPSISFSSFKGQLLLSALLLTNFLSGQLVSITSIDPNAAEVTLLGAPNTASFTISRPIFPPALNSIVSYAISATSTSSSADHNLINGSVVLTNTPGGNTVTITVLITDDLLVEGGETLIVELISVLNVGSVNPLADEVTINIVDNDTSNVTLTATDPIAKENTPANNSGTFTIDLGAVNNSSLPITISYSIDPSSTATQPADYFLSGNTFVLPGSQTANITFSPVDDIDIEGDETVTITLASLSLPLSFIIAPGTSATVTIEDNECVAGAAPPALNSNTTTLCDVSDVNLNTFVSGAAPGGSALSWSSVTNPTEGQLLSGTAVTAATSGAYITHGLLAGTGATFCKQPIYTIGYCILNSSPSSGTVINPQYKSMQ